MYIWSKLLSLHGIEYIIAGAAFFVFIIILKTLRSKDIDY